VGAGVGGAVGSKDTVGPGVGAKVGTAVGSNELASFAVGAKVGKAVGSNDAVGRGEALGREVVVPSADGSADGAEDGFAHETPGQTDSKSCRTSPLSEACSWFRVDRTTSRGGWW
jgi:hypothetical protein